LHLFTLSTSFSQQEEGNKQKRRGKENNNNKDNKDNKDKQDDHSSTHIFNSGILILIVA